MSKNLLIVESPAKAKTIEKYLGSDFRVLSSVGHIRSIVKKTSDGTPPIDVANGFKTQYEVDPEKTKIVRELKKAVKEVETVYLATDPDREGEAIAWHLCEVLGLDPKTTKRVTYHEISKAAIEAAIKEAHLVDMDLVQAQQARQILDRLVGFELSPVVWQKVPGGKSAGRVQSPAVRLLVEREREINKFEGSFQFKVTAEFSHNGDTLKAELPQRFDTEPEAQKFLESLVGAQFSVTDITTSPSTRNPAAPFTTSTLQQDANAKLGFGSKATMSSAQKLYQEGKITYMRTDSVNLSGQAIAAAADYIKSAFGPQYSQVRTFKTKSNNAQEAHEAIRPTDMRAERGSSNEYDQKLYTLIRNRTLASQMAPAKLEKTTVTIAISTGTQVFEAKGEVIIFDGFLKVYGGGKKDPDILPAVANGDTLDLSTATAKQIFARPPARFTEGSLVKKLEELGIGRPSTYATIIGTVQARGYAEKGDGEGTPRDVIILNLEGNSVNREVAQEKTGADKGKLVPTPSGELISDFLSNHFDQIVDYGFTADVEEEFDQIATGALARNTMLERFYKPFHMLITESGGIDRATVGQSRDVGIDPKSGKPIIARFGRFGPMLQLGSTDSEEKPQFAPMPARTKIESITLEEALYAFKLPRVVGQTKEGIDIKANIGRFGPYIQIDKLFVSIKPLDPHEITLDQALELYDAKLKTEAEKNISDFGDGIKVLNGRYGPYITDGKKNAKIPKDVEPKDITHDQAKELLANAVPAKGRFAKKTTAKTMAKKAATKKAAVKKTAVKKPAATKTVTARRKKA
ncbi:DNA topoisomerase I [Candidatus Saccharibacteria bacterium RIFCSPHIGHO2_01_FULL_45_15]|nr:MAG: DNA topoisomerase I [Candidatus Saccharibacteria bacterium RIFCSPHIGHO2_01_FULL_45_15]OGL31953.1 MAG: DNA topoisomerase I [Candidatus Saccharibacteria bacterium RIFCSPHIGHO2_12_FULL_44_22]